MTRKTDKMPRSTFIDGTAVTREHRYEVERKRIFDKFQQALSVGTEIKFNVEGEQYPRIAAVVEDKFDDVRLFHNIEVIENNGKTTKFHFKIGKDLRTVQQEYRIYDDDEEERNITIVNDDLMETRKEGNAFKHERSGPKLNKFSTELGKGTALTIGFEKQNGKRVDISTTETTVIKDAMRAVNDGSSGYTEYVHDTWVNMNDEYNTQGHFNYHICDDLDASLKMVYHDRNEMGRVVSID